MGDHGSIKWEMGLDQLPHEWLEDAVIISTLARVCNACLLQG